MIMMMNNDETTILWEKMGNIYDIGVEDGEEKIILNADLDLSNYVDNKCYNGYEPLENYINRLIEEKCKEAFKAGADAAKKGYV